MSTGVSVDPALSRTMRGDEMLQAEEVAAMLRLHGLGWGAKRLAKEFGCARNTVRRYLRQGGPMAFRKPVRRTAFDGLDEWLRERFFRHGGNADVVRQELASELGIVIGLRSVELRVHRWRRELKAQMRATVRFETAPGRDIKSITVIRTASGKYFASILNEDEVATPVPVAILSEDEVLRADAGLANLLTESRGRKTNNPRFLKRAQRNLRRNQKALSRKKKGSKNREGSVEDCQGA